MPKEVIHTSKHPDDNSFNVEVGWTRDMDVQLGVSEADGRSMWWVYGEQYTVQIGQKIHKIVEENKPFTTQPFEDSGKEILNFLDVTCGSFDSLWATMDRKQINDLIRALRKARDAAFGRDE